MKKRSFLIERPRSIAPAAAACLALAALVARAQAPEPAEGPRERVGEEAILEALSQPTEFEFVDVPLVDAVTYLADRHRVAIRLDRQGLDELNLTGDEPVTARVGGVTLRSGLNHLLGPLELGWAIQHEVLLVTSRDVIENDPRFQVTRTYAVADLVETPAGDLLTSPAFDAQDLIDVVTAVVDPTSWTDAGGPGSIEAVPGGLVVRQTRDNHDQIAELLSSLRRLFAGHGPSPIAPAEAAILAALAQPTQIDFQETPLAAAVAILGERHGLQVLLDSQGLEELNITPDYPLTGRLSGASLGSTLTLLLESRELGWAIRDEALLVTSLDMIENDPRFMITRTYPAPARFADDGPYGFDRNRVVDLIILTVDPTSWVDAGGPGAIEPVPGGLVIATTRRNHDEVARLLASLDELPAQGQGEAGAAPLPLRVYHVQGVSAGQLANDLPMLVGPGTWANQSGGGAGLVLGVSAASGQPISGWLFVRQTDRVHRDLKEVLEAMRVLVGIVSDPDAPTGVLAVRP